MTKFEKGDKVKWSKFYLDGFYDPKMREKYSHDRGIVKRVQGKGVIICKFKINGECGCMRNYIRKVK
jgi:hypothetical protein